MSTNKKDIARFIANYRDEIDGAALYRQMAADETQLEVAELYLRLAKVEETHAEFWRQCIERSGGKVPSRLRLRARILIWASKTYGPQSVLPLVAGNEIRNRTNYDHQQEVSATEMPKQERAHARMLSLLASRSSKAWNGTRYSRLEGRHSAGAANNLRAIVLGANDGLVSTFCLAMGVAGTSASSQTILVSALAGALAGACSMAMGEWISVQSARELQEQQVASEAEEMRNLPAEEKEELRLIYRAKGFSTEEARQIAERVFGDKHTALDTLVREELGINPDDMGGSAMAAAMSSFGVFLLGAFIPTAPMLIVSPDHRIIASVFASVVGLFLFGVCIAVFTGNHPLASGLRQLFIGLAAAGVTFLLGSLIA